MKGLSHHECHVLALVQKWQPTTAYFLRKALTQRLASDASDSPGSVYPAIERLKRAGLVQSEEGGAGRRKSEFLTCTEDGAAAVRRWLVEIDQNDLLPSDPWRTRVPFIEALPAAERSAWFLTLRMAVSAELEKLERLREAATELPSQLELEHARLMTTARLAWINEAIALLASA